MDTLAEFLADIDWRLLRDQKLSLLKSIEFFEVSDEVQLSEHLTGILHLIDALQDEADKRYLVPAGGWLTEEENE